MQFISTSEDETEKIGKNLIDRVIPPAIFCLYGELGSGKTTLVRGAAKSLGIMKIRSPTFVYLYSYKLPHLTFYHLDLYRIQREESLYELGLIEIFDDLAGIVFIEWAEKVKDAMPKNSISIYLSILSENKREIVVKYPI